jgi:hypothetical protein
MATWPLENAIKNLLPQISFACRYLEVSQFQMDQLRLAVRHYERVVADIRQLVIDHILEISSTSLPELNAALATAIPIFDVFNELDVQLADHMAL